MSVTSSLSNNNNNNNNLLKELVELEQLQVILLNYSLTSNNLNFKRIINLCSLFTVRLREYETLTLFLYLNNEIFNKIQQTIIEYKVIMNHYNKNKYYNYYCSCFQCFHSNNNNNSNSNKNRINQNDENYAIIEGKLIEGIYLIRASILKYQNNQLVNEFKNSYQFSQVLSDISASTAFFDVKDTVEGRYACREKLRKLFGSINEYKSEFVQVRLGRLEETPKRFRDIQESLQISIENPRLKKEFRQVNRYLYDLASLGCKLLSYKCDSKLNEISNFISMSRVIEQDQIKDFQTLESSYSSLIINKNTPNFNLMKEFIGEIHHSLSTELVENSQQWSTLKSTITSSTFLSTYFGSGDEDLDEMMTQMQLLKTNSKSQNLTNNTNNSSSFKSTSQSLTSTSSTSNRSNENDESFTEQMKKIFLDSFNNNINNNNHSNNNSHHSSTHSSSSQHNNNFNNNNNNSNNNSFNNSNNNSNHNTNNNDSNHSKGDDIIGYTIPNHRLRDYENDYENETYSSSDLKILRFKSSIKASMSNVANKAVEVSKKAAASAGSIASSSTQKAVNFAAEAKNKVRRSSGDANDTTNNSGGTRSRLMMMTGSYTALVDMN